MVVRIREIAILEIEREDFNVNPAFYKVVFALQLRKDNRRESNWSLSKEVEEREREKLVSKKEGKGKTIGLNFASAANVNNLGRI